MHRHHRNPDTERDPDTINYHRADCEHHPAPERPRRTDERHHRSREVAIGGEPGRSRDLFEEITPGTCGCGGSVETAFVTTEWPPIPITTAAVMGLLRRTDGYVALRVEALGYPDEPLDWLSLVETDHPARERAWYLGAVGGRLVTRTRIEYDPVWSATTLDPGQLGRLLRRLPSEPRPIWQTNLDTLVEDYEVGRDVTAGVPTASVGGDSEGVR